MRIVVAEDDQVSRRILEHTLTGWHYEVETVKDGREALSTLLRSDAKSELAIIDWMMPEMDGPEVCRRVRAAHDRPFIYIILLSGKNRKQDIVMGMEAGADDYLVKPYDTKELRCRIRAGERIIMLTEELHRVNAELEKRASTDHLTQQMNRGAITGRLEEELSRAERDKKPLAVCLVDIDHFKRINDSHGHASGDTVLRIFAQRLRDHLRVYDAVGRYGGEEFLLILPGIAYEDLAPVLGRLHERVRDEPIAVDGERLRVTASYGVSWLAPGTKCLADDLVQAADEMLYQGKNSGRDQVQCSVFSAPQADAS